MSLFRSAIYRSALWLDGAVSPPVAEARAILAAGERASAAELRAGRDRAFVRLVRHCYDHVPYYKSAMDQRGIDPAGVRGLDDLQRFPVLTRDEVRSAGPGLSADNVPLASRVTRRSGGTTGEPIASHVDRRSRALETYALLRGYEWMGWTTDLQMVTLFGGSLGRPDKPSLRAQVRDYVRRTVFLPAFELRAANADRYLDTIAAAGPCILNGYASALINLANLADGNRTRNLQIKAVFSTAEMMPADWAARIGSVFRCPVVSYYGCGEVNSLGFQLQPGGPYIVPDEHVALESASVTTGAGVTLENALLVTSLYNYAQPLIRYVNGDAATLAPPGELHPTRTCIRDLLGRTADMFAREDGSRLSSIFGAHVIFRTGLSVKRYQFIQRATNAVEFRYERLNGPVSSQGIDEVVAILRSHLGESLHVDVRETDEFLITRAGKHRIMVVDPSLTLAPPSE